MSIETSSKFLCWGARIKGLRIALVRQPGSCRNQVVMSQLFDHFLKPMRIFSPTKWAAAVQAMAGVSYVAEPAELAALADAGVGLVGESRMRVVAIAGVKAAARLLLRCHVSGDVVASVMRLESERPPRRLLR